MQFHFSRELFEIRTNEYGGDHSHDFLCVGNMGHAGSIAGGNDVIEVALNRCSMEGGQVVVSPLVVEEGVSDRNSMF